MARKQNRWPSRTDTANKGMSSGISLERAQTETLAALSDEYLVSTGALVRAALRVGLPTVRRMLAADRRKGNLRDHGGGGDGRA